jgi:S1-C subfamily serine protease
MIARSRPRTADIRRDRRPELQEPPPDRLVGCVNTSLGIARKITAGELWLPELGYSTSLKDALAIGVPPEREEDAHIAVRPPQSPPGPEPSNGEMVVATGTGFIINDRGDLVTNNNVVDDVHGLVLG